MHVLLCKGVYLKNGRQMFATILQINIPINCKLLMLIHLKKLSFFSDYRVLIKGLPWFINFLNFFDLSKTPLLIKFFIATFIFVNTRHFLKIYSFCRSQKVYRDHSFSTFHKIFQKTNIFYLLTHTYVGVSWGKKCWFFRKFCECTKWMIP